MSDTKRILPWEFRDNAHNVAQAITKVDLYWIHPKEGKFMACIDDEVLNSISTHDTLDAAMDACEADYISRCTERLELVRPGNVQIPAEMFAKLAESWCGVCEEEGLGDCKTCDLHALKNGLPIVPTRILADDEVAVKRETAERLCVMSDIPAVYGYGPVAKELAHLARANGYVKLEPGQVVVDEHPFTDEEADYLLEAIEWMKCNDCNEPCGTKARGNCLYLNIRAKLTEIKEARDE